MEIASESENLVPNLFLLDVFNKLSAQGRSILVISDTHFENQVIGNWLRRFGFEDCSIFTSQEFLKTKSTGLFAEIQSLEGFPFSKWIHIGDNPRSDVHSAGELGIQAIHFPKLFDQFENLEILSKRGIKRLRRNSKRVLAIRSYLRQTLCLMEFETLESGNSYLAYLGLFVGAPVSRSIAEEMHREHLKQKFDIVLYSSRDGWLPYLWHRELFPSDPVHYFKTSRAMIASQYYSDYVLRLTGEARKIAIFDFGWRGSTLKYLVKSIPQTSWSGFFWQVRNVSGLNSRSFQDPTSHPFAIWRARDFVELIFTDPSNGYANLNPLLEPIERSAPSLPSKRLDILRGSISGIQAGLPSLTLEESAHLLELFAKYPSTKLASELAEEKHDVRDDVRDFLVTNSWSRLLSKNRVMWPGSAYLPHSTSVIDQFLFRMILHFKELFQRLVNLFNARPKGRVRYPSSS
jgi:hypothetical protein